MYSVSERNSPLQVKFADVPSNWKMATSLEGSLAEGIRADNYDRLVDSPIELGTFDESDFDEGGGHYRVVVDADAAELQRGRRLFHVTQHCGGGDRMDGRPSIPDLSFHLSLPRKVLAGVAWSTPSAPAIDVNVNTLVDSPLALPSVSAHEFFSSMER